MPSATPKVTLKPGHVQPVWMGHPWVYAQAIDRIEGGATAGDEVSVHDPRGNLLGRGFYSPGSAIPVRLLTRDAETHLDAAFFRARIEQATALRASLGLPSAQTTGFRLIHAEGDGLPGLVVDKYGDSLAVQVRLGVARQQAHRDRRSRRVEASTEEIPARIEDAHLVACRRTPLDTVDGLCVNPGVAHPDGLDVPWFQGDFGRGRRHRWGEGP